MLIKLNDAEIKQAIEGYIEDLGLKLGTAQLDINIVNTRGHGVNAEISIGSETDYGDDDEMEEEDDKEEAPTQEVSDDRIDFAATTL
jgi:hypothetical protein